MTPKPKKPGSGGGKTPDTTGTPSQSHGAINAGNGVTSAQTTTGEITLRGKPGGGGSGTGTTTPPTSIDPTSPTRPIPSDRTGSADLGPLDGVLTRDADGLITHVDGKPIDQHLRDLAAQRTDAIRQMREDGTITAKEAGPVNSVGVDTRTGEVFEGVNGRPRDVIPDDKVHPVLRERLEQMRAEGPYPQYNKDGTPMMRDGQQVTTPYPHGDNPLRHAEVKVVNEMLWRRGPDADASVMSEFRVDNRFPFRSDGPAPAPCCANCHRMLAGTPSNAGRLTHDSGHPDSQFLPE